MATGDEVADPPQAQQVGGDVAATAAGGAAAGAEPVAVLPLAQGVRRKAEIAAASAIDKPPSEGGSATSGDAPASGRAGTSEPGTSVMTPSTVVVPRRPENLDETWTTSHIGTREEAKQAMDPTVIICCTGNGRPPPPPGRPG